VPNSRLYLSMYGSLFVRKYRQKYRRLRIHLHRQLRLSFHLDLNLDLDLDLNPSLYRELLAKSYQSLFQQLFASLFGSMFDLKNLQLQASSRLALYRQMLPPKRPVGRPLHGRIVVLRPADTIRCGAYVAPWVCVRMIQIRITRVLSSGSVTS
jgi:hypothetical protein